jgi:integrase
MSIFKNGRFYHYVFQVDGHRYRGSTGYTNKQQAIAEERRQRERLEKSYSQIVEEESRQQQRKTVQAAADEFLGDYKAKHQAHTFAEYALGHVTRRLGKRLVMEITPEVVKRYQAARRKEKASPKTINDEVAMLLRLCGEQGEMIRSRLKHEKALKLRVDPSPGKPFSPEEQERMLAVARQSTEWARRACERRRRGEKPRKGDRQGGSPSIYPALVLALNGGMRDSEIRRLTWSQIDWEKKILTVGRSKTEAGTGRTIPLNGTLLDALLQHTRWYAKHFGAVKPEWFVFPGGSRFPKDPARPIGSLKTAWNNIRRKADVTGRWHDNRHTLITELAENGAGDETIMEIAGHVSRQMLSRYAHIRTEAKRKALEEVERKRAAARDRNQQLNRNAAESRDATTPARLQ